MGHRCNLVLRRAGVVEAYYSHWGALSLLADLLSGPDCIADWLKHCKREDQLLDSIWSEGIALADFDDALLLLRGGVAVRYILPARLTYLEMLRDVWRGWRVAWAHSGVVDVARHLGLPIADLDKKPLRCPSDAQLREAGTFSWVTVAAEETRDVSFRPEPGELLLVGLPLLEYCRERAPGQLPAEDQLAGGLLLKPAARYLGWWSAGDYRVPASELEVRWPGWRIQELPGGLRDQAAGSGRDPLSYALSVERARDYVARELFPSAKPDPVGSMRRLEAKLRETGHELIFNPDALNYPRPGSSGGGA